jgi:hypothetical protein
MESTLADRVIALARQERADEEQRLVSAATRSQDPGADFLSMQVAALLRETFLTNVGFDQPQVPAFLDVVLAARKERELTSGTAAADEEGCEDRSRYAVAELPPGIPAWPPEIFTAVDQQYTRRWQRSMLCKIHDGRGGLATSQRLKEGGSLFNAVLG